MRRLRLLLGAHYRDRVAGTSYQGFGDAAHHPSVQPGPSVGCHRDEISRRLASQVQEGRRRCSSQHSVLNGQSFGPEIFGHSFQVSSGFSNNVLDEIRALDGGLSKEVRWMLHPYHSDKQHFQGQAACHLLSVRQNPFSEFRPIEGHHYCGQGRTLFLVCLALSGVTVRTGTLEEWSTLSVMLPGVLRPMRFLPWVDIAINPHRCKKG